jgi:hypothetical protein
MPEPTYLDGPLLAAGLDAAMLKRDNRVREDTLEEAALVMDRLAARERDAGQYIAASVYVQAAGSIRRLKAITLDDSDRGATQ